MSKQRQKGTSFETAVVNVLKGEYNDSHRNVLIGHGKYAEYQWLGPQAPLYPNAQRTGSRAYERADIEGVPGWAIECKNQKQMALSGWVDQAITAARRIEALDGQPQLPVVIHKRRGKNTLDCYATMPVWAWGIAARLTF